MTCNKDLAVSPPGHLSSALPRSAGPVKGLPEAANAPLNGLGEGGSHLAGDQAGTPLLGSCLSGEEALRLLEPFDRMERESAARIWRGEISPTQHMSRVKEIREARAQVLDEIGFHVGAQLVRDRLKKEMSAA